LVRLKAVLVIEVVSTNWSDDYALKFEEYSNIGIPEYWIVDYLGLGGKEFIGYPKQPTITVCNLENNVYQRTLFRKGDRLQSAISCDAYNLYDLCGQDARTTIIFHFWII
jgi:Uma2 family endonuclease